MQRLYQPTITFVLALIAIPIFTGIHVLFLYLTGYIYWFRFLCTPHAPQGDCTVVATKGPLTIDNNALFLSLTLLFFTSLLLSALAAWLTHRARTGLLICLIAVGISVGVGVSTLGNAENPHEAGPFASLGTVYVLWAEGVILLIVLIASWIGSYTSLRIIHHPNA